jgi:hypothetical protein
LGEDEEEDALQRWLVSRQPAWEAFLSQLGVTLVELSRALARNLERATCVVIDDQLRRSSVDGGSEASEVGHGTPDVLRRRLRSAVGR